MRTESLAQYAAGKARSWEANASGKNREFTRKARVELNTKLAGVTVDTLRTAIDEQTHLIAAQENTFIVYLHLDINLPDSAIMGFLEDNSAFESIKRLARDEGFISVSPVIRKPATKIGTDLLLHFKLPEN